MSPSKPHHRPGSSSDKDVQALLVHYRCPTPFHVLRTLFLGYLASPKVDISPLAPVAQAWGGEMPEFATTEEAEEVIGVLVQGFWNRLAEHQNTRNPFRLLRFEVAPTRRAVHELADLRAQELKGFVDGLFGSDEEMLLPEKAHQAMAALSELHTMFDGAAYLLADEAKPASAQELKALLQNLQQMTIVADAQINKAVQSCKRARGQRLEAMATVMLRKNAAEAADDGEGQGVTSGGDDQEFESIESPLSQTVTRNGVAVQVEIYGDSQGGWILEIVDPENTSHVWDEPFESDQQALTEALCALDEEPLEFFGHAVGRPS